jgi:integrase
MPEGTKGRQRRGDGTIYQTADGRHRAAVTIPHALTGEPIRRYLSGRTVREVQEKLKAARADREAVGRTPTVATWGERWLALVAQRVRPATLENYRTAIRKHVIPAIGSVELARLRPTDVEAMTAAMATKGLKGSTIALTRRVLVVCLSDAMRDGIVIRNAAALARPPRVQEPRRRALDVAEVRRLLEAIQDDPDEAFITLAVTTGMRRGEIFGLRWQDVDLEAARLQVTGAMAIDGQGGRHRVEPKTRRSRRLIALLPSTVAALKRRRSTQRREQLAAGSAWQDREGFIFTDAVGRPADNRALDDRWEAIRIRAGLPGLRLHDLRHTAATLALSAGVPVRDVADSLGHATPSITLNTYGHSVPEGPRRVADALERAIAGGE